MSLQKDIHWQVAFKEAVKSTFEPGIKLDEEKKTEFREKIKFFWTVLENPLP